MSDAVPDGGDLGLNFLAGGGEMGALMRARDWTTTAFGRLEAWPQSLRSAVSIMLNSRFPIALYWGPELALLYNDAWRPIPGNKHPWALGQPGREVWPEIWDTIGPLYAEVLSSGQGVWQEDELLPMLRHGYVEECYYNFTFSPVRGEDGAINGIFNAVVETTDRVISERRLRTLSRMGERADAALSVTDACRWVADLLGENAHDVPFALVYLRDGEEAHLCAATGVEPESPIAAKVVSLATDGAALFPLGEAEKSASAIVVAAPENIAVSAPIWPEPISQLVVIRVITGSDARATGFLVAGVNARRRMDAQYRSFFELAAGHVGTAIGMARAYEEQRSRAEALAELDRAKTTFFANISHEFRTPLTLMLGPLEELLAKPERAVATNDRALVQVAHRNGERLLRLVNALLDFSRIEAGRAQALYQPTDLASLTGELASSFRSATDRAGLELVVDAPVLSQPAYVDRDMWEKIVLNLVSNAFKFTLQGQIEVVLREDAGQVRLTVRDTGVGIPKSELPDLFKRFHRVEGSEGRSFEGSGIGLALVQELVQLHGGEIAADSEPGQGSTFTVTLPLGSEHLPPERVSSAPGGDRPSGRERAFVEEALLWLPESTASDVVDDSALSPDPTLGNGLGEGARARVLLADDNADLRRYITRLLHEKGYDVVAVADGHAALARMQAAPPDILITDVMMPGLDGFALLRAVREDSQLRDIPVIMLSARAGEEAKVEGLDANADDYLTKPFSARELLARVESSLAMARMRRETAESLRELNETLEARVYERTLERDRFWRLSRDPFLVADSQGRWVSASPAWTQVLGWSEAELLGRTSEWMEHPDDRAKTRKALSQIAAEAPILRFENRFRTRDGDYRWFSWTAVAEGDLIYAVARDVTVENQQAEALRQTEEALRQAQKMEAMGQLTGGVAHDFNNLLTPIVGSLDMLQRKGIGGEREHRLIGGALQSAERARTLVQRLLAFARRQPLQVTAVDVARLVSEMGDLIASTSGPQIKVVVEVEDDLPPASADPNQLEMALLNLAVNSRDAMPEGGTLRITVNAEQLGPGHSSNLKAGHYVRLSVADTGVGMDAATMARAVEPFYSTKGVGKGTGLGLSMAHGLASQLGGALTIQSRQGVGTNIELWLPVSDDPAQRAETALATGLRPAAGRALLVDDEELVRMSIADMLGELGYEVAESSSAEEALHLLHEGLSPDIVLTDHLMPGMSGVDLARVVRAEFPDIDVLVVSGFAESDGIAPDLPRITKPFRNDELATSLAELRRRPSE